MDVLTINARIHELQKQRDEAMDRSVVKAGELALAYAEIEKLRKEIEELKNDGTTNNSNNGSE